MRRVGLAFALFALFLVAAPPAGHAQQDAGAEQSAEQILKSLKFRSGAIPLGDKLATIRLPDNFRYLDKADAETFLTRIWQNPPGVARNSLGLIIPTEVNPMGADGWAVIVSYEASGHVSDEEAGKIDYAALLKEMQASVAENSKARVEQGYEPYELIGWAREPYYDAGQKKLFWAKRLRFGTGVEETLNYDIRALGRRGVLSLNIVAAMDALAGIDQRVNTILGMVEFNTGETYADFNPDIDQVAAYGLAGLIAGGVLTKAGFFKGLIALALASKKLLIVGAFAALAGLWAGVKALFRRRPTS